MYDHGPSDHTEGALAVRYLSAEVSVGRGVESFPEEGEVECDDRIILDNQRCRWACRRERLVPRSRRQEVLKSKSERDSDRACLWHLSKRIDRVPGETITSRFRYLYTCAHKNRI